MSTSLIKLLIAGLLLLTAFSVSAQVTHVDTNIANVDNSGSMSINRPTGTLVDDMLVAYIVARRNKTGITGPAGWTKQYEQYNGATFLAVFWKVATPGDVASGSYTFNFANDDGVVGSVSAYRGIDTVAPFVGFNASTGDSVTATAPSISTGSNVNTMVLRGVSWRNNNNISSPVFERLDTVSTADRNSLTISEAQKPLAAPTTTGTAVFTGGDNDQWIATTFVFRAPQSPTITANLTTLTVGSVMPPSTADYRLVISNTSPSIAATNVTASNTLPAGFTFRSGSVSTSGTCPRSPTTNPALGQSVLSWGTWTMNAGCVVTINYTVDISTNSAIGLINDDASVSGANFTTVTDTGVATDEDLTVVCSINHITNTGTVSSAYLDLSDADNSSTACTRKLENSGFVSGVVWLDEDKDGINDIEEGRLTNVSVELRDGVCVPNSTCPTVRTDQFGNYAFRELLPGNYDVVVQPATLPTNVVNTDGPFGLATRSIVLASGQTLSNQDFGYKATDNTGIIGDRIWSDANADGVQDPGEAGIAGVTLTLRDAAGGVVDTTTTNADGDYLFTGIPFGPHYTVTASSGGVLTGFTPTVGPQSIGSFVSAPITLNNAVTTVTDIDFGFDNPSTITITDRVWFDADGSGTQNGGEPGIAGVTMELLNSGGDVVATATTNASGDFSFSGVPAGSNYSVKVSDRNNALEKMVQTTATTSAGNQLIAGAITTAAAVAGDPLVLNTVGDDGTPTFGYNRPGSISGIVWSDAVGPTGASALQDNGEPGIAGVIVTLTPPAFIDLGNGAGVPITALTESDGRYSFNDLPPADYTVQILVANRPTHTLHTKDPDNNQNHSAVVSLPLGESLINQNFGYRNSALNPISGTVFLDRDKDGVEEPDGNDGIPANSDDESGIAGVTLALKATFELIDGSIDIDGNGVINANDDGAYAGYTVIDGRIDFNNDGVANGSDDGFVRGVDVIDGRFDINGDNAITSTDDGRVVGSVLATTTSDSSGDYTFNGVVDGDYVVEVTDDDGIVAGYDSTSGLGTLSVEVTGAPVTDVDFGYIKDEEAGSISGEVWIDEAVTNGLADEKETNLSEVTLYLCRAPIVSAPCDPSDPEFVKQTITDARGEYVFDDLPAATYKVDADSTTVPADLTLTVDPAAVALSKGEKIRSVDIGYEPDTGEGVLSGFVWTDVDSDGFYDAGEAPIGGVTVYIYGPFESLLTTAVTKPDGSWIVTGLTGPNLIDDITVAYEPGDIPVSLVPSQPTNMPLGEDRYFPVNLQSDADGFVGNLNFGFPPTVSATLGSVTGTVYSDADESGDYDSVIDGEFQAITLNLVDCGADGCGNANDRITATTSTDSNGNYSFSGIPDGEYRVVVSDVGDVLQDLNILESFADPLLIDGTNGRVKTNINQGYVSNTLFGSVGNRFWLDTNGDGIIDDDEPGIEGITIQCWADNNRNQIPNDPSIPSANVIPQPGIDNLLRTTVTDQNGEYYCTSMPTGQYMVIVFDSLGFTEADDGTLVTGSAADNRAKPWRYTLTTASPNLSVDFGVTGSNSIGGKVFIEDEGLVEPDLDGTVDAGVELDGVTSPTAGPANPIDVSADTPAVGVIVALYIQQPNGTFSFVGNTVTNADGDYSFGGLPDGDYRVVVQPSGSTIDGFGQTGDPDLVSNALGHGDEDLVCDSPTSGLCDNATVQRVGGSSALTDIKFWLSKELCNDTRHTYDVLGRSGAWRSAVHMGVDERGRSLWVSDIRFKG